MAFNGYRIGTVLHLCRYICTHVQTTIYGYGELMRCRQFYYNGHHKYVPVIVSCNASDLKY